MKTRSAVLMVLFTTFRLIAQDVRPVCDNVGFCWNADQMERLIRYVQTIEKDPPAKQRFIAGISAHDDYLYAARIYFPLFRTIKTKEVVIFGVTHGKVRKEIGDPQGILLLDEYKAWKGCGRNIKISPLREFIKSKLDTQYYRVSNTAHQLEHSIEAMVPWLQYYNPEVKITPIMVTAMSFERMDEVSEKLSMVIAEYVKKNHLTLGTDIFFLCSSDANHYGKDFNNVPFGEDANAHQQGIDQDLGFVNTCLVQTMDAEKVHGLLDELQKVYWCGRYSISFGMLTVEKTVNTLYGKKLMGTLLRYSDTYTEGVLPLTKTGMGITAVFSLKHWVGWLSAGYWME